MQIINERVLEFISVNLQESSDEFSNDAIVDESFITLSHVTSSRKPYKIDGDEVFIFEENKGYEEYSKYGIWKVEVSILKQHQKLFYYFFGESDAMAFYNKLKNSI